MRSVQLTGAALAALAGLASASPFPSFFRRASRSCNGAAALCDRKYSNVTFVGSHDSSFVGILPTQNQYTSVADQLALGVRYLQTQSRNKGGTIELCHTSCAAEDAGTLAKYLATIKTFLDANANEVVSLLITNPDSIAIASYGTVFTAAGLDTYAYAPSGTLALDDWPTLGSLIDSGKRLVVFMDYHADTSVVSYINDEFSYYYETPYSTTDENFPQCTVDRPSGASTSGRMGIVNHFLDFELDVFGQKIYVPFALKAAQTNSVASITAQTNLCVTAHDRTPSVVLLDFISVGHAMDAQNTLNGL